MSGIETLFMEFIYTLTALALAFTGYNVYDRYVDRQDKKDMMRSIADTHNMTLQSMTGIHSISKTQEAIEKSEKKEEPERRESILVEVHHKDEEEPKPSAKAEAQAK